MKKSLQKFKKKFLPYKIFFTIKKIISRGGVRKPPLPSKIVALFSKQSKVFQTVSAPEISHGIIIAQSQIGFSPFSLHSSAKGLIFLQSQRHRVTRFLQEYLVYNDKTS